MWKLLVALIFISNAHAQNFLADISKIQHTIAENEVDAYLKKPIKEKIPLVYLDALMPVYAINPVTLCLEEVEEQKPLDLKYKVILVTQEVPASPQGKSKTTVVLEKLKFEEQDSEIVKNIKNFVDTQGQTPGKFSVSDSTSKGKQIVTYAANGLSVNLNTSVKATNSLGMDVKAEDKIASTMSVDLVNRLDIKQKLIEGTELNGSVESLKSTGTQDISRIGDSGVQVDRVNAEVKLSTKVDDKVSAYTGVMYRNDEFNNIKEIKTVAGINITLPNSNQIVIFTGETDTSAPNLQSKNREYSVHFKMKRNTTFYGKIQDNAVTGKYYEAGVSIDLDKN